ncbi:MAG TPA: Vms1/Ankzf1 family peptidyl-tRNA hydrolase [Actinomycetota bacterium]
MEASESIPAGAVSAPALVELACRQPGPFASVYLVTEGAVENAPQLGTARWKSLRDRLADAGTPDESLRAIDEVVPGAHTRGGSLAVVANASGVVHVEHTERPEPRDRARWAMLPELLPIVRWRQERVPFVAVVTDRTGADLVGVRLEGTEIAREVQGAGGPIRKVQAGGWSQRRYQQRAENTWEHNAHQVAEEAAKLADRVGAAVVVLAGDVRAVSLVKESIPERWAGALRVIPRGGAGGSPGHLPPDVEEAVSGIAAEQASALIEHFHRERGQDDRAADGPAAVVDALRSAQVEVLLVADDPDDERTAWFGPEPAHLALRPEDLAQFGIGAGHIQEGRLLDVLVRATLGTGAGILVIPRDAGPKDDVGAVLRWSPA